MTAARALAALLLAAAPASALAEGPPPTAEAVTLAGRYLAAARAQTILEGEGPVVARYMLSKVPEPSGGPAKAEEVRDAMIRSANEAVTAALPKFLRESSEIYARIFTLKELKDIVAFYESASGRTFVAKTAEASSPVAELIRRLGDEIQVDTRKRFCASEPESCKSAGPTSSPGG